MNKPTLVIMAAGMGSRFGGCKQVTPVDEYGHAIIDFSAFDALRAGFGKIVFVIKPEMEADFRSAITDRMEAAGAKIELAYQTIDRLPEGYSVPEGRVKPWGTAHAVLCAADAIDGDFAAINADDYYGRTAFEAACGFLTSAHAENEHAMVGYRIENTLSENGYVSRGECETDANGMLKRVTERVHIERREGGAAYTEDGEHYTFMPAGTIVSMNMWAFGHSILDDMKKGFVDFLETRAKLDPCKAEYYLPSVPDAMIREGRGRVRVIPTTERWYGMTYHDDLVKVQQAIRGMRDQGMYPEKLW